MLRSLVSCLSLLSLVHAFDIVSKSPSELFVNHSEASLGSLLALAVFSSSDQLVELMQDPNLPFARSYAVHCKKTFNATLVRELLAIKDPKKRTMFLRPACVCKPEVLNALSREELMALPVSPVTYLTHTTLLSAETLTNLISVAASNREYLPCAILPALTNSKLWLADNWMVLNPRCMPYMQHAHVKAVLESIFAIDPSDDARENPFLWVLRVARAQRWLEVYTRHLVNHFEDANIIERETSESLVLYALSKLRGLLDRFQGVEFGLPSPGSDVGLEEALKTAPEESRANIRKTFATYVESLDNFDCEKMKRGLLNLAATHSITFLTHLKDLLAECLTFADFVKPHLTKVLTKEEVKFVFGIKSVALTTSAVSSKRAFKALVQDIPSRLKAFSGVNVFTASFGPETPESVALHALSLKAVRDMVVLAMTELLFRMQGVKIDRTCLDVLGSVVPSLCVLEDLTTAVATASYAPTIIVNAHLFEHVSIGREVDVFIPTSTVDSYHASVPREDRLAATRNNCFASNEPTENTYMYENLQSPTIKSKIMREFSAIARKPFPVIISHGKYIQNLQFLIWFLELLFKEFDFYLSFDKHYIISPFISIAVASFISELFRYAFAYRICLKHKLDLTFFTHVFTISQMLPNEEQSFEAILKKYAFPLIPNHTDDNALIKDSGMLHNAALIRLYSKNSHDTTDYLCPLNKIEIAEKSTTAMTVGEMKELMRGHLKQIYSAFALRPIAGQHLNAAELHAALYDV